MAASEVPAPEAQQSLLELLPGRAQTGRDRVHVRLDDLRNLGRAHLLDLSQDEDLALVLVESGQKTIQDAQGLDPFQHRAGAVFVIGRQGLNLGWIVSRLVSRLALVGAPVVPHHVHQDLEDPGLELGSAFEFGQPAVHHEEYLLHHIICIGWPDPHATHRAPHKIQLSLVHRIEVRDAHASWQGRGFEGVPGRGSHADDLVPGNARLRHQKRSSMPALTRTPTAGA